MNKLDEEVLTNLVTQEKQIKLTIPYRPFLFQKGFRVLQGTSPILLSAPHAGRTIRDRKIRVRENYVGSIVHEVHQRSGAHAMYTINVIVDPNRHEGSYKRVLRNIISDQGVKCILDIHGASDRYGFDVDVGTYMGDSVLGNDQIVPILKKSFKKYGIKKISEGFFTQNRTLDTVTNMMMQKGIPTVQLEFAKKFRYPKQHPEIVQVVLALTHAVKELEKLFAY